MEKEHAAHEHHDAHKNAGGLSDNVKGLLCYVAGWVGGIVMLVLFRDNHFVRFHSVQSIVTFLGLSVISFVVGMIPVLGWLVAPLLTLLGVALWIILMVKAYRGERYKLPWVGDFVESLLK